MKLTVEERILVYGMQPQKGPYDLLAAFKTLEPRIRFNEEETRKYDIKQQEHEDPANPTGPNLMLIAFNKEVAEGHTREVKIPARCSSYLSEELSKKEEAGELTYQYISIYERFCLGKTPSPPRSPDANQISFGKSDTDETIKEDNGNTDKQGKSTNK